MIHSDEIQQRVNNSINSGVQVWSQSSSADEYYVFASDMLDSNVVHLLKSRGINYKDMIGRYTMQGTDEVVQETSFIINANDISEVMDIISTQESVLFLSACARNNLRHAYLLFVGTVEPRQYLGQLQMVSEEEAEKQSGWTYCPYSHKHFICTMKTDLAQQVAYTAENLPLQGD